MVPRLEMEQYAVERQCVRPMLDTWRTSRLELQWTELPPGHNHPDAQDTPTFILVNYMIECIKLKAGSPHCSIGTHGIALSTAVLSPEVRQCIQLAGQQHTTFPVLLQRRDGTFLWTDNMFIVETTKDQVYIEKRWWV